MSRSAPAWKSDDFFIQYFLFNILCERQNLLLPPLAEVVAALGNDVSHVLAAYAKPCRSSSTSKKLGRVQQHQTNSIRLNNKDLAGLKNRSAIAPNSIGTTRKCHPALRRPHVRERARAARLATSRLLDHQVVLGQHSQGRHGAQ
jgi:hypothetical protein